MQFYVTCPCFVVGLVWHGDENGWEEGHAFTPHFLLAPDPWVEVFPDNVCGDITRCCFFVAQGRQSDGQCLGSLATGQSTAWELRITKGQIHPATLVSDIIWSGLASGVFSVYPGYFSLLIKPANQAVRTNPWGLIWLVDTLTSGFSPLSRLVFTLCLWASTRFLGPKARALLLEHEKVKINETE